MAGTSTVLKTAVISPTESATKSTSAIHALEEEEGAALDMLELYADCPLYGASGTVS